MDECMEGGEHEARSLTATLVPMGHIRDATIPEEPSSLLPASQLKRVELPWEDLPEKRYPPPDPSKFTEYERRYPPDKYGEEHGPNARLFKIYRDRVTEKDEDLVNGWNDTINFMLVFAGLFSAVLTALLIESSKRLQPDYSKVTAVALLAILAHLQGAEHSSIDLPTAPFQPDNDARWINGLWFTSLMLALIVSLLSILVKQWLVQYMSLMRSSAEDAQHWAWRHSALRRGLSKWGVEPFISLLAVLLHISLFLFFIGLVRFIHPLDEIITTVIIVMSAVTAGFYLASTIAPLIWTECPTRTPFTLQLDVPFAWLHYLAQQLFVVCRNTLLVIVAFSLAPFAWFVDIIALCVRGGHSVFLRRLEKVFVSLWRGNSIRILTTFESRLTVGQEQQLTDQVILWLLGPENQLTETDTVAGIDAIGAIDFESRNPEQLSSFGCAHISSAINRQFQLLTRAEQANTAERAASIGRVLRAWIVVGSPVNREAADRLRDLQTIRTHDVPLLADELISRCSDENFNPPEWLTREIILQLAIRSADDPYWATLFGGTALAIYSKHNGRDAGLIKAITESRVTAVLVIFCLCAPEDVDTALLGLPDDDSCKTVLRVLPQHLTGRSMLTPWHQYMIVIFSWVISKLGTLKLTARDQNAIRQAYRVVFPRQVSEWTDLESALLPFATSPEFVQSCGAAEINSAWNLVCDQWNTDVAHRWSGVQEEIIVHLLERRAALFGRDDTIRQWKLSYPGNAHTFVVDYMRRSPSIEQFERESALNLFRPHPATACTTTSTWRLYPSMSNRFTDVDCCTGWHFAVTLALLSRAGLESGRAKALLHELAGDDRGIQLLLGNRKLFVQLAIHAKTIDPEWWIDMKPRILDSPLARWGNPDFDYYPSSQRKLVDAIESAAPCEECAEAELKLRQILGVKPPMPAITLTPVGSSKTVEGIAGTRPGTPMPIDAAIFSSSSSSRYGDARTEEAAREQRDRAITLVRAVARPATPFGRRAPDLEMQALQNPDGAVAEV